METDGMNTTMKLDLMMTTLLVVPAVFAVVEPDSTICRALLDPPESHSACGERCAEQ